MKILKTRSQLRYTLETAHRVIFEPGGVIGTTVLPPSAPVLILVSATSTAVFTVDVDNTIGVGDSIELQVQLTGGSWSPLFSDTVHTITTGEDAANQINLSLGLPNGSYDARARVEKTSTGLYSSFSNTVTNFTISGVVLTGRLMWSTDQQLWGAPDHLVWS
jgi:hypothetical protein